MAPPAPGRFTTRTRWPRCFPMPSASMRAVTSADVPAGKSTVISTGPRCGIGGRFLAVDVHEVVLGSRRVARVERGERAVLVLENEARHIGVVAGENQAH